MDIRIDPKTLPGFECPCGNAIFEKVYVLKIAKGVLVGLPTNALFAIESHRCAKCLRVVSEDDIQGKKKGFVMPGLFLILIFSLILSGCVDDNTGPVVHGKRPHRSIVI